MPAMLQDTTFQTAKLPTPPLPVGADQLIEADLDVALSTPSTLVVNASLEVDSGERPLLAALLDAAQAAVARATRGGTLHRPRRVLTRVGGRPHLVTQFEAA
jgi:hypothetical protein